MLIYSIAVFFVLDRLGVPITGLVAPATVLGVGLGFGAQRIVGDVLAGFFIITERQYGFGDVVSIAVTGAGEPATGTVEDVTLRVTRMRSPNGEVVTVPNGGIAKVVNLSRDWARAVVDVPIPTSVDVNRVNEILREVGRDAFRDPALRPLLLDPPSVMGVESLDLDQVNVRMVARTLPGKQFEVGRALRARVVHAFRDQGLNVPPPAAVEAPTVAAGPVRGGRAMTGPTQQQPAVTPTVTTAPARSRWRVSKLPPHLGPARTSTVILVVLFLSIGALYLYIRPETTGTAVTSNQQPAATTAPAAPTTAAPTTPAPETTDSEAPTTTTEFPTTESATPEPTDETTETPVPEEPTDTGFPTTTLPTGPEPAPDTTVPPG